MAKDDKPGPGRPRIDLGPKLQLFETALVQGHKVGKSLEIAAIPESTYYLYLQENPEYLERVQSLKVSLEDVAERALASQLNAEPKDEKHRQEIAALAKWTIDERRTRRSNAPTVPQLGGPQNIQINVGAQQITKAEDLEGLTDEELQLVGSRKKTYEQVIADRKLVVKEPTKASA